MKKNIKWFEVQTGCLWVLTMEDVEIILKRRLPPKQKGIQPSSIVWSAEMNGPRNFFAFKQWGQPLKLETAQMVVEKWARKEVIRLLSTFGKVSLALGAKNRSDRGL